MERSKLKSCLILWAVLVISSAGLVALGKPTGGAPAKPRIPFNGPSSSATGEMPSVVTADDCAGDADCDDQDPCTIDRCETQSCAHEPVPDCVPCTETQVCPLQEVVFIMDTSGSMVDQAIALCAQVGGVLQELADADINVHATILGITQGASGPFTCLTDSVVSRLGADVPGEPFACTFPNTPSANESWGPATAIVAERFPWTPGALRMIIPLSDESPCDGDGPSGCKDPGADRLSVINAIEVAQTHQVVVSPMIGSGANGCTFELASDLAGQTGGVLFQSPDPAKDLTDLLMQALTQSCAVVDECDDLNPCTEADVCRNGVCSGTTRPGCTRCSDSAECDDGAACTNDECELGACVNEHGPDCVVCGSDDDCDDSNVCTLDLCIRGFCEASIAHDPVVTCCSPSSGILTPLDDGNGCTADSCDVATGVVSHIPRPVDTVCDDGDDCTLGDHCTAGGGCAGVNAGDAPCDSDADCVPAVCDPGTGQCTCGETPSLVLNAGSSPTGSDCFAVGEVLEVRVEAGLSQARLSGGQFLVDFDPSVLAFLSAVPGNAGDPSSPFTQEFVESLDLVNGRIFHAVGVAPGNPGVRGPVLLAVLRFRAVESCVTDELCFESRNPQNTVLTDDLGQPVAIWTQCSGELTIDDGPPQFDCPLSREVNADAGQVTTSVSWAAPDVQDACGIVDMECHADHEAGAAVSHLISTGGRFPRGRSEFSCSATDACGREVTCDWHVDVADANGVDIDIQLSPSIVSTPVRRCIEFAFYADCVQGPDTVTQVVEFGGPFDLPGRANEVRVKVPPGDYQCVTARDALHTLRAVSEVSIVGNRYVAKFQGDPFFDGNWLVGGNLDGNNLVDIVDFGIFISQYLTRPTSQEGCDGRSRNADINGDGIVDQLDFTFIRRNFLAQDKNSCCPGNVAAVSEPITSVDLVELNGTEHNELVAADLNADGRLDEADLAAFQAGVRPIRKRNSSR